MKKNRLPSPLMILIIVGFLGALGCGLLPAPETGTEIEIEFWSSEEIVAPGECAVLHWGVQGAEDYPVFLNGEQVAASDEELVCLEQTTTYELVVGAPGGPDEESVTIHVSGSPETEPMTTPVGPPLITPVPTATPTSPSSAATQVLPTATSRPPAPTATSRPPAAPPEAPRITYFRANGNEGSITVSPGTTVTLSWEWERVAEGYLDPGNIALACPALPCSYQVSPGASTTYTLRAVNPSGSDAKTVTVEISSSPPGGDVPPGGGSWGIISADLAVTDLYMESGKVYGKLTNNGPDSLTDMPIQFSCEWSRTAYGDTLGLREHAGPRQITITSLAPGQTAAWDTYVAVDLNQFWYDITCGIQVDFDDPNPGNNSFPKVLSKQ